MGDARAFAIEAHKNQMYGDKAYVHHLDDVFSVLELFYKKSIMYGEGDSGDLFVSAYLHDVVEDTHVTLDEISNKFGDKVAALVWAVSDGEGKNRAERKAIAYKKILAVGDEAISLKLADRIANVRNAKRHHARLYKMYTGEQAGLRDSLYLVGSSFIVKKMWKHLDGLFEEI